MADLYGATQLPVQTPGTGTVSDPALDAIAAFCSAVLTADCATAWAAVAAGETIVRAALTHDPNEADLGENNLPALFVFRTGLDPQQWDDQAFGADSTISILWVFPPGEQFRHARRLGILSGVGKALHRAFGPLNGRHPSWVVVGDTDPSAAAYGSSVLTRGGLRWARLGVFRFAEVRVGDAVYEGIMAELRVREDFAANVSATTWPTALATTIDGPGGFDQTTEQP
jgi:hypothetical protein